MKKIVCISGAFLIILVSLISIFNTAYNKSLNVESKKIASIYNSSAVTVMPAEENGINYTFYEYVEPTYESVYEYNTVILRGKVLNVQQATINYEYMGADVKDNITIFEFESDSILYSSSSNLKEADVIKIGIPYNMNNYGEGLPIVECGKEYLLFCYVTADKENDILEMSEYIDCWIRDPRTLLIEKVDNYYLVNDFFAEYDGSSKLNDKVLSATVYEMLYETLSARTSENTADSVNIMNNSYFIDCRKLEEAILQIIDK